MGEVGWLAFKVGRQVHEPQHFDGVADCMVLGCGLSPSVRLGGGGVHVAHDDCGGEHGYLAVCPSQGLAEGFHGVAEGDVGVDDVELPSVLNNLIDTWPLWDAEVVDESDVDAGSGVQGGPLVPVAFVRFQVRGIYTGVVSGGTSRCRPCSWKARRLGTHSGPCAIRSSWRAVVASLEYVTTGWLRSRRLTVASVGAVRGCGGLGTGALGLFAGWWALGQARRGEALATLRGEVSSVFGVSVGLVLFGAESDGVGAGELQGVAFWLVWGAAALV